ncbi:MAG: hypothetical protein AB1443_02400 [Pseudomonadota bacterium]
MPQRRVLFFDNARLTAYRVHSGTVLHEASFAGDEAGLAAFGDYLQQHRRSLFLMLADVAEESFQTEDIPHSSGKDRQSILRRKLAQHFYGTPYALAFSQGRIKSGRRDERLLLMALTQPQHIEPWAAVLHQNQAILAGIYSLPQTIFGLLPAKQTGKLLLLTLTHAGLRQTFFDDGQMRFSRLTPLIHDSTDASALAAASEAVKMHQYLASQRLIERDKPLTTRVLAHPAEMTAMRAHCHSNTSLRFEIVDMQEAARHVGLRSSLVNSQADMLFCHLLVRKTPTEQFAQADELKYYRLWQTRFGLKAAGALALASAVLFVAHQGFDILQLQDSIEQAQQQTRINQEQYTAKMQALPQIPINTDDLRTLIGRYDQIALRAQGPAPLLAQISRSLDEFPQINIDRIEWAIIEQITPAGANASTTAVPPTPIPPPLMNGPYAQATVNAHLPINMVGDHRGQLSLVADFAKHLGTAPDTLITVLQLPVDTQSGKTLKSGDERSIPEAPKFIFRVTRKL